MKATRNPNPTLGLISTLLICVALVPGCGGNEEFSAETSQAPATEEKAQQRDEESTQEKAKAPNKNGSGKARDEATLEISGDDGTEFSGSCTVGDVTSEIAGQVPENLVYELDGQRLECEINTSGNLQVNLSAGNNTRSVQQVSGGTLSLTYEDGQVSSSLSSSGSGAASSSSQVVSSSQSSSSSIEISP